jgi:Sporulation and spore germination
VTPAAMTPTAMTPTAGGSFTRRGLLAGMLAGPLTGTLAGCGLPHDGQVQRIDPARVPYGLVSPAPTGPVITATTNQGVAERTRVYWLKNGRTVVAVPVRFTTFGPSARLTELLELLAAGPTTQQRRNGFGTALGPGVVITVTAITDGVIDLDVQAAIASPPADRLPLAVGQMVLTATSSPSIRAVRFVRDGEPLDVPLIGGALTSKPLGRSDYAGLLRDPSPDPP